MNVPMAFLADYSNVSQEGKLNVLGIFDKIFVRELPAFHPQMYLVLRLTAGAAERGLTKKLTILLLDADGEKISAIEGTFTVPEDAPLQSAINEIIILNGLGFPHAGDYSFHILINGEEKTTIPFAVESLPIEVA